jgi:DNA modification methylase
MDIYSHILRPLKKAKGAGKITFRNLITWRKDTSRNMLVSSLRMFSPDSEKCLFVMKGAQEYSTNKDDYWEGFEPIRQKLVKEKEKAGLSTKQVIDLTTTYASHYFAQSQWAMITEKDWNILRDYCTAHGINAYREEYDKIREEYDKIREEWYATRAYFDNTHDKMTDVWEFPRTRGTEREEAQGHATPKPLDLCARAIKSSSREGELVLDLFGGSGSTLIACEQLNRKCAMLELSPHWCDVIIARWERATGEQAVRLN